MADDSMLAVFVDRTTMRHERTYPHGIESVWDTVTTSEQLNVWLLPVSKVDRRLGGRCSFRRFRGRGRTGGRPGRA